MLVCHRQLLSIEHQFQGHRLQILLELRLKKVYSIFNVIFTSQMKFFGINFGALSWYKAHFS
jgi:hypothetical protein